MSAVHYVTKEALEALKEEINRMKTSGRAEIARQISEAREKGDLKENAEYDAAKEAQGLHEAKLANLEATLANSRVLDPKNIDTSKVSILSKVRVKNLATKKSMEYQIVSESEADLKAGKISVTSPIAKGLLGKVKGDVAEITVPNGVMKFQIEEINI
ncbi:transcription elongation factor GreA [Rurimicrobium arvi]|uniref:Transcription elongation factor GreA n=1 Tax=Rurimicrobium arvi TaxID=2049916 RepID=A0ABP8MK09_9BACT